MRNWRRYAWFCFGALQVLVFLIAAEKPANAYVDPGSGLLFLQVGGSMLAGAMFVLRQKIRKLLRLGKPEEHAEVAEKSELHDADAGPQA